MLAEEAKETFPEDPSAETVEPAIATATLPESAVAPAIEHLPEAEVQRQADVKSPNLTHDEEDTPEVKARQAKELEDKLNFGKVQEALSAEGVKEKSGDTERRVTHVLMTSQRRRQIEKLFVAPPDYLVQQQPLLGQVHVGIIDGPDYADCMMCAEHLGLLLTGEILPDHSPDASGDQHSELEAQVEELLRRLDSLPNYSLASHLALRLDENLRSVRIHNDSADLQYTRSQLTLQLNRIALSTLGLSLKQLHQQATKSAETIRNLRILDWSREEQQPLTELVKSLSKNDFYVVRSSLAVDTEFGEQIEAVSAHLNKHNISLVFVQQRTDSQLLIKGACQIIAYPPLDTDMEQAFIRQTFQKYFAYFGAVIPTSVRELLDELITIYINGRFSIAGFFDELRSLKDEASEDEIRALAESMGNLDPKYARRRFQEWPNNHRLYAMLIVLFTDVKRPILDRIYMAAVAELRNSGITTLCDPREIGMDDMLHTIRAKEMDDRRIYFQYALIATEVDRQIDNHHHLLWSLLKIILGWVDRYRAPEYWQLRKSLGAALGRMGLHQMEELTDILDNLAHKSSGGVVVVAGYALDRICRVAPDKHEMVVQILRRWAESGDPDLMWATGASAWRIYDSLIEMAESDDTHNAYRSLVTLDEVSNILTTLVQTFKHFNGKTHSQIWQKAHEENLAGFAAIEFVIYSLTALAAANLDAILHAIRQIASKHPARMVTQIRTWLQVDDSENQQQIGLVAGCQLFEVNAHPEMPLSAQQQLPLLGLIQPLLAAPEEFEEKQRTVNIVMQALLHWITYADWSEQIHAHLLYLLNRSTAEVADLISDSIARYWLESDFPKAKVIGRALIVRAYAIHGTPLDMPDRHKGLILLDAADNARANQEGVITGLTFYHRLAPRLDLYLRRMGDRQLQIAPDQSISPSDLQLYHALPALMMPTLEISTLPCLAFILILTWDRVIDADDLAESDVNRLTVALFGEQALEKESLWPKQAKVIAVQRDGTGWATLNQAVNQLLARALVNQSAAEWWSGLQPYFAEQTVVFSGNAVEEAARQLQSLISRLDQLEDCRYPNDLMRIILCTTGWLAKVDLTFCIATLQRWLESDEPNQRIVGTACSRFLFTLFQASESPPLLEPYAQLLQLAPFLGQQNWDAVQTILQAAYHWSADANWQRLLLLQPNGAAGELITMIDKTATLYSKQMTRLFDAWTTNEPIADNQASKSLTADFVTQLRLRLALSSRQPLPGLLADHMYGLILIDTAIHNPKKRQRLTNIAAKVIEQLAAQLPQSKKSELQLLIYWLGRDHLLAGPGERPTAEMLIPTGNKKYPRLFGPLLDRFTLEQISFVCLFTDLLPNDAEDWRHSELHRRILFYTDEPRPDRATRFTVLPKEDGDEDKTVVMITNYLLKHVGG